MDGSAEEVAHIHILFLGGGRRRGRGGLGGILGFVGFFICSRGSFSSGGSSSHISEELSDTLSLEGLGNSIDEAGGD